MQDDALAAAHGITWDLSDLYSGVDDPRLLADLDATLTMSREFAARYRGTIHTAAGPSPELVAEAVAALERVLEQLGKATASVDFPEAGRPVIQIVHALCPVTSSRSALVTAPGCHTTCFDLRFAINLPRDKILPFLAHRAPCLKDQVH